MMPLLVVVDGGQSVDDGNSGLRRYVMCLSIEGYVTAATSAGIGPALSNLYARTVEQLLADHTLSGLTVDRRASASPCRAVRRRDRCRGARADL